MNKFAEIVVDVPVISVKESYLYSIPDKISNKIQLGNAVRVPFGAREVNGFVVGFTNNPEIELDRVKPIKSLISNQTFFDENMLKLCKWTAAYYHGSLLKMIKAAIPTGVIGGNVKKKKIKYVGLAVNSHKIEKLINELEKRAPRQSAILTTLLKNSDQNFTVTDLVTETDSYRGAVYSLVDKGVLNYFYREEKRRPFHQQEAKKKKIVLNREQVAAMESVVTSIKNNKDDVFLLHGVTGSGKTEVYLNIIERVLTVNKSAIILVPEISLTPVMVKRFYTRFQDKIAVLHSSLSLGERYDEWRRLKNGEARIAIGARSAIFSPVRNLGLIIIDEEHENSYKQGEYPYYHARMVARKRGKLNKAPVLLGTATPSLESFYRAQAGKFKYLALPDRINQKKLPPVTIVDMREELKQGNMTIFSSLLLSSMKEALKKKEQILLFLNRRGYSNFVLCRDCGHVIKCQNCDISLTYHRQQNILRCHYCDYSLKPPAICPQCGSKYIRNFGVGTQKVAEVVSNRFPEAIVDRMDVDTTSRKGSHRRILQRLEKGETDILVGTQMIAKGHDYPNISVVGVITADTILNLPDFRSSERTFQLLTQVAGRTGRGKKQGKVIIQTYSPEHYSIEAARNHDFQLFSDHELELRKELKYPPFSKLVNIIIKGTREDLVTEEATKLGVFLHKYNKYMLEILGPSTAPLSRIRNQYRWQIILKFKSNKSLHYVLNRIEKEFIPDIFKEVNINIDVDPLSML